MILDSKEGFTKGEKLVSAVSIPLGNALYRLGNKTDRHTVGQLLAAAGIDTNMVDEKVKAILGRQVSQVCRSGSRFTKDCICVQLYEDAHGVLRWAMEHGALLCVARYPVGDYPCIVTAEPAAVYADMCRLLRKEKDIPTVAVAGSIGKTTAKKMIHSMLCKSKKVFCDTGNDNQLDGVGYFAQHIPSGTEVWVQEVSEDIAGMVTLISKVVAPKIAVVTAVDKSHIEEFGSEQGILDEIASVTDYMPEDGVCITSIDDANTAGLICTHRVRGVSLHDERADFYAKDIRTERDGLHFAIVERATGQAYEMHLDYVFAEHNIYAALYAFACGVELGLRYEDIVRGIERYRATGVRQNIWSDRGVTIYADCYNAVASSVRSAVKAAEKIPVSGKRIAVIGDIAETGDYTEQTHRELLKIVNESEFDILLAYGVNTCAAARSYPSRANLEIVCCTTRTELNAEIRCKVHKGDLVLFKASHSMALEKSLMASYPSSYIRKTIEYYWPQLIWRWKVLTH